MATLDAVGELPLPRIDITPSRLPIDFRVFLHRYGNLLRTLPAWTVRVLVPPHLIGAVALHEAAARDELAMPLPPATVDELRWYFEQRRDALAVVSNKVVHCAALRKREQGAW